MAEDLPTGVTWHHPEWLMVNAGLNPHNVMDYFSESPFWDKNSNNATLKMQTQFNALSSSDMDLKSMTGIEFELIYERWPALFVIRKQRRRSPAETIPLAVYYILDGIVHQSPDLYSVIANRMLTSLYHLSNALAEAKKHVEFHPAIGYTWKTDVDGADGSMERAKTTRPEQEQEQETRHALKESPEFRAHLDQIVARSSEVPDRLRKQAAALARTARPVGVGGRSIHGNAEGSGGETTTRGGGLMTSVREALSKTTQNTAAQSQTKTESKQQRRKKGEGDGVFGASSSAGGSKRKKQKRG